MREKLKMIGLFFAWILALLGLSLVGLLLLKGGVRVSEKITPWLFDGSWLALSIVFFGLLPLCVSKETRAVGGGGLCIASYVFGATLWFWSLLITYTLWGWVAVIIGLLIAGVGVFPTALLATAFNGQWKVFGELILLTITTFGSRGFGLFTLSRYEQDPGDPNMPIKLIVATWLLFGFGAIPSLGYVSLALFLCCGITLLFSRNRRRRKHGLVSLGTAVGIMMILFLVGWFFPNSHILMQAN